MGVEDVDLPLREADVDGVALLEPADPLRIDARSRAGASPSLEIGGGVAAGLFGVLHRQAEAARRVGDRFARLAEMLGPQADDDRLAVLRLALERRSG